MADLMFVGFPPVLVAHSIWRLSGIWRLAAIGCFVVVLLSWVTDFQGAAIGGNLAGIYTAMLAKPVLVYLLILYGTYIAARKSKRLQNPAAKYTTAMLSSVFLFPGFLGWR